MNSSRAFSCFNMVVTPVQIAVILPEILSMTCAICGLYPERSYVIPSDVEGPHNAEDVTQVGEVLRLRSA